MRNKHTNEIQGKRAKAYELGEIILLVALMVAVIVVAITKYLT